MKKRYGDTSCKRKDCRFYNPDRYADCQCLYSVIMQRTKLSQIPKGEKYDIQNCQFYECGKKKKLAEKHPPTERIDPHTQRGAAKLSREPNALLFYEMALNDKDIAKIYDVTSQAVAHWRKIQGLGTCHDTKRLDWKEIIDMMREGFSNIAIARYNRTSEIVIAEYRKTEASHNV